MTRFRLLRYPFPRIAEADTVVARIEDRNSVVNLLDGLVAAKNSNLVRSHSECASEG